jgi:hypothetical protein
MGPSSGEIWFAGCTLHTRQSSTQINKYQASQKTVVSADDGPIVARNMKRLINTLRINCAPSWFYLQDYTGMHGQQNIKYIGILAFLEVPAISLAISE